MVLGPTTLFFLNIEYQLPSHSIIVTFSSLVFLVVAWHTQQHELGATNLSLFENYKRHLEAVF